MTTGFATPVGSPVIGDSYPIATSQMPTMITAHASTAKPTSTPSGRTPSSYRCRRRRASHTLSTAPAQPTTPSAQLRPAPSEPLGPPPNN